ncbi:ABC transporter permease [Acidiluteibacter ferrifornacis]|uniref:FtsX-like permease family protein n=1 Tax=Acidiluteibacter ferrifornacis TaxID=2692424 RepID=A0A6N9NDQ5_9FLAO|nr:ABC transporter permease [Acidiluteibacter ferrifornacis]NBG64728.1 FtsX-like permease family protein [Acidiluteibacter ferrifornacis]
MLILKLLKESFSFAINALIVNKLRTFLSLLGITIGIFAIISVYTMVDALEKGIKDSIASLGDNVVYVMKWPWSFDPDQPWWEYMQRPQPTTNEFREVKRMSMGAEAVAMYIRGSRTIKYKSNSLENVNFIGVSYEYNQVADVNVEEGRYFTEVETNSGSPVVVIGASVGEKLFGGLEPMGRQLKFMGRNLTVIGMMKKEGESMLGNSNDDQIIIPINFARTLFNERSESLNLTISVKAKEHVSNADLMDELTGIMRSIRKLKPKEKDNFALNELDMLSKGFDSLFSIVNIAGGIIGIFSIIVGGFSIANIMFVSVKERTNIIGIQKALGAKNYFILFQFLFESIFLCLVGGLVGLLIIFIGTLILTYGAGFEVFLTMENVTLGISISVIIGLISGFIPAWGASRMDPVEAIRQ